MRRVVASVPLLLALPAAALDIQFVAVRDAGNACDPQAQGCFGAVGQDYAVSRYEITNGQYVQFLNEVANEVDAFGLYNPNMEGIDFPPVPPNTERFYVVEPGFENKPVVWVSFYDALRFANWLHNGQPHGLQDATTTEDGAYTITPAGIAGNTITRNPAPSVFLPTEDEWYKAAYYDAATASYFDYPVGSNSAPLSEPPPGGSGSANFYDAVTGFALTGSPTYDGAFDYRNKVGAYTGSPSPYGTFDQGGNVNEWTETANGSMRVLRGGSWDDDASALAGAVAGEAMPTAESDLFGFRIARVVPEPGRALLLLTGALVLSVARPRRRPDHWVGSDPSSSPPVEYK